jgi:lipopolysaccharide export system protein LptC|tara:strand:- start:506 stop:1099 length:594 start_codon:yes stop_codon:yes gene_type:complete
MMITMSYDYSFYINSLKKILFFIGFVLIVLTFLNKSIQKFTNLNNEYQFDSSKSDQVIIEPKFLGLNKNKKPFLVKANKAEKINNKENVYRLQKPSGEMKDNKGTLFFLKSLEGEFDQNNQKIHLFEDVYLKNLEGLSFKTESAYIDLETNDIYGNVKTFGFNNNGKISSQGFKIKDQGDIITFKGPANLIINNGKK